MLLTNSCTKCSSSSKSIDPYHIEAFKLSAWRLHFLNWFVFSTTYTACYVCYDNIHDYSRIHGHIIVSFRLPLFLSVELVCKRKIEFGYQLPLSRANAFVFGAGGRWFKSRAVQIDTVLPTACRDVSSNEAVLPTVAMTRRWAPANSLQASAKYSEYIEKFELLSLVFSTTIDSRVFGPSYSGFHFFRTAKKFSVCTLHEHLNRVYSGRKIVSLIGTTNARVACSFVFTRPFSN